MLLKFNFPLYQSLKAFFLDELQLKIFINHHEYISLITSIRFMNPGKRGYLLTAIIGMFGTKSGTFIVDG
jgi:hypothetical protein